MMNYKNLALTVAAGAVATTMMAQSFVKSGNNLVEFKKKRWKCLVFPPYFIIFAASF